MGASTSQPTRSAIWALASRQHDRVTYAQLRALGLGAKAIRHRVERGTLAPVARGVFAISRPRGTPEERWMEDALRCGDRAVVGDMSAAALWGLEGSDGGQTHMSLWGADRRPVGIIVHRRSLALPAEARRHKFIPVTSPALTLIDNANRWGEVRLEAAINKADGLGIASPDLVRATANRYRRVPGATMVTEVLDRLTFELTDSELERMFRRLVAETGLPQPLTQQWVDGYRVDFFWPDLGLIVEADSLRYHRTATQQAVDRRRDRAHASRGLATLRFTHYEICFEDGRVTQTLGAVIELRRHADRLTPSARPGPDGRGRPR